jgi:PAS domain S-box-containing protein
MKQPSILIVEDEIITALDIQSRLKRAGYDVPSIATSGEEALATLSKTQADLVLMDIRLKGTMDGIQAAGAVRDRFGTPVVYLTAYADQETLGRAKITEPHGYLLKPFEEKDIRTTVEMALYKHKMEKKLKENERWLSTTLRSIGDAVIATGAGSQVKFMNPVAEHLTGWAQDEALGRDITDILNIVDERTDTPIENPVMVAIQKNAIIELPDHCLLLARDGREIPIADSAAPIRDEEGKVIGGVMVFRDITEQREADRVLQQHAQDLREHNQELDAFAHTVAHDLKGPVNLIIGFSEILKEDIAALTREEMQRYLHIVEQNGAKMSNIIDELLLLSETRRLDVQTELVDMGAIVNAAQLRLRHMIEEEEAEIVRANSWPLVMGHGPWLEEVWVNYLSNAIKYGGQPPRIELGVTHQGDMVRFWIKDNGPGVPPEDQARLFTPFTRLDQVRAKGHGLGLSIVRRIVEKLGGRAGIESDGAPGQGSLFYFELPSADVPSLPQAVEETQGAFAER